MRILHFAQQAAAQQCGVFSQQAAGAPTLCFAVAEKVENQVDAGPLASDVVLQISIKPVVFAPQFGRHANDQRLSFEAGQAEQAVYLREQKRYFRFAATLHAGVNLRPQTRHLIAESGGFMVHVRSVASQQPRDFIRRDAGDARNLPFGCGRALQSQRRASQAD